MEKYLLIDVNIFLSLILVMIIGVTNLKQNYKSYSTGLFLMLCRTTIIILALDSILRVINGLTGKHSHTIIYIAYFSFYLLEPLVLVLWLCYLDYQLYGSIDRLRKRLYYIYPVIAIALIMVSSIFTDFIFNIDEHNDYQRGAGNFLIAVVNVLIILYSFLQVYKNRHTAKVIILRTIVMFGVIPIIGTFIQLSCLYGMSITWPSVALSVVSIYIFLETQKEIRDYLTGLLNRQQIEELIQTRMGDYQKKGSFSIIMIDMDGFKSINDKYGHKEGDRALVKLALIMKESVKGIDKVARFGGDEFLILVEDGDPLRLRSIKQRIIGRILEENRKHEMPYEIKISAGSAVYTPEKFHSLSELTHAADQEMYEVKRRGKKDFWL